MMNLARMVATVGVMTALLLAPGPAVRAQDDHERARAALESGQAMPLVDLLNRISRDYPGEVLDVELEHDHHGYGRRHGEERGGAGDPGQGGGRGDPGDDDDDDDDRGPLVYEIKLRTPEGRILKLVFDAHSGALLASRERHH